MYKIKSAISLSIALIILSGIVTNVLTFNVNDHTANALSTTNSSSSPNTLLNDNISSSSSSNSVYNNNDNIVANVSKQYQQQLSSAPHTREYTLIAENTTLEIAPGLRVDAWTYNGTIPGPNITYTYDVIAQPAGALGYHCHVPPVMQHVRMGLYGAFIVYPKTPLPPAREYVLVDGEYDTQNQLNPLPEYYMFNEYTKQMKQLGFI